MNNEMLKFLLGEGPLEGIWFGDTHPTRKGMFWWRKILRQLATENQPNGSNMVLAVSWKHQLCPKCFGEGQVANIGTTSSLYRTCPVCDGAKTLRVPTCPPACASGAVDTGVSDGLCHCVNHTDCECIYENKCSECGLPLREASTPAARD